MNGRRSWLVAPQLLIFRGAPVHQLRHILRFVQFFVCFRFRFYGRTAARPRDGRRTRHHLPVRHAGIQGRLWCDCPRLGATLILTFPASAQRRRTKFWSSPIKKIPFRKWPTKRQRPLVSINFGKESSEYLQHFVVSLVYECVEFVVDNVGR